MDHYNIDQVLKNKQKLNADDSQFMTIRAGVRQIIIPYYIILEMRCKAQRVARAA